MVCYPKKIMNIYATLWGTFCLHQLKTENDTLVWKFERNLQKCPLIWETDSRKCQSFSDVNSHKSQHISKVKWRMIISQIWIIFYNVYTGSYILVCLLQMKSISKVWQFLTTTSKYFSYWRIKQVQLYRL